MDSNNTRKRGRNLFDKYSKIITILVEFISIIPINGRNKLFRIFRNKEGYSGLAIRYILLKSLAKNCGKNVSIFPGVYFFSLENLTLGNNVSIHPMCYIDAVGEIEIGDDVSIAHGTTILSSTHNYSDILTPIKNQGMTFNKTIIKDNVWIGAKVTILNGIIINSGSIIAAGAVVTKNVIKENVVAGVPAKIINQRR